jgi:hypothetical protein
LEEFLFESFAHVELAEELDLSWLAQGFDIEDVASEVV